MAFYSVCGLGGSGKSLYQLHFACKLANRKRTILVSNLALNLEELHKYCGMLKYGWLAHQIEMDRVHQLPGLDNVLKLFEYRRATILLDEAGIYFNTRHYAKMPPEVLAAMAQLRHDGNDLIWAAQYFEQVDKSFRMLCHRSTHAYGVSRYSPSLKNDELTFRNWATFDPISYEKWLEDKKARSLGLGGFIRTRMAAMKVESGLLRAIDRQAFKCFSSFDRVEDAKAHGNPYTLHLKPYHQVGEIKKNQSIERPAQHSLSDREIKLIQGWSRVLSAPIPETTGDGSGAARTRTHASDGGARRQRQGGGAGGGRSGAKPLPFT
jgi:hypothetical protein